MPARPPGPGLLNAASGIATAWALCAPVVTLCGQVPSHEIDRGTGLLHEIPGQPSMVAPITRSQRRALEANEISGLIAASFADATRSDPRPVLLELPPDVMAAEWTGDVIEPHVPEHPGVDPAAVEAAADRIADASCPMLVVGAGAQNSGDLVTRLAERVGAPVVAHRSGRGVVDGRHPLAVSTVVGQDLWPAVDVVVGVGSRMLTPMTEWGVDENLTQIWIDPDAEAPGRTGRPDVHIAARAEDALPQLIDRLDRIGAPTVDLGEAIAEAQTRESEALDPLRPQLDYLDAIRSVLPDDGILISDLTQVGYVSRAHYEVRQPKTYLYPSYMGTLGWALPTALGAKVANPDTPVVAVMGDGGFGFTGMELATAAYYSIPTTTIVFDNRGYGNVRLLQKESYGGRVHATDLHSPDLVALAGAFDVRAVRADSPTELGAALTESLGWAEPTLIWVPHGDWPSPWPVVRAQRVRG